MTYTFHLSLEVGVRVDAYAVGCELRHIESAYFTFIAPDDMGNPITLLSMRPENEVWLFVCLSFIFFCICERNLALFAS